MCGIAGIVRWDGAPGDAELAGAMVQAIRHRGPDGWGVHADGPAVLGHARLAIVDLAGGAQPMSTDDGRYWITFNGEIFNHVELRAELDARGHRFVTTSDTEVILHLYRARGPDCVREMNGQWAFAIWDRVARTLFLSRDRLGVRPLYWTRNEQRLAFASEMKALFAMPDVRRELDPVALDQIATLWSPVTPRTVFEDIQELAPGTSMTVRGRRMEITRHWELTWRPEEGRAEHAHADRLREALDDATRLRLTRADVPVGAYLSGGLDSTVIAALARRHASSPLRTFSIGFEDPEFDESEAQRRVIDHLGVAHTAFRCTAADVGRVFPDVVWHAEQPMVRTAPAPMFLLSRLVREHGITVVLTGEGSDELMGGYDLFKEDKVRRFIARQPASTRRPNLLRRLYPWNPSLQAQPAAMLRAFFHARAEDLGDPVFSHLTRFALAQGIRRLYSPDLRARLGGRDAADAVRSTLPAGFAEWDSLARAQSLEIAHLLPGYLLSVQGDRMAMAHGVEARYPFLDPRVVAAATRVPASARMRALEEKHLLKVAARDLVLASLLRRPKQPYRAPTTSAFFDPETGRARFAWVEEAIDPKRLRAGGLFEPRAVKLLVDKLRTSRAPSARDAMALTLLLSAQLVLDRLVERFERRPSHVTAVA